MKNKSKLNILLTGILLLFVSYSYAQKTGTFTDSRDGKAYKTIKIGSQVWMSENLAYKASNNCWAYNNKDSNAKKYGYMYKWETANEVCPDGWQLPSKDDYNELILRYGVKKLGRSGAYGPEAHAVLKKGGRSRLDLLKGGRRTQSGDFREMNSSSFFWSSTEHELEHSAYYLGINECSQKNKDKNYYKMSPCVIINFAIKQKGGYVRCIKK
ncbi:MAG: FISUMP domain-containing protein [Bacteroidota bacterium]